MIKRILPLLVVTTLIVGGLVLPTAPQANAQEYPGVPSVPEKIPREQTFIRATGWKGPVTNLNPWFASKEPKDWNPLVYQPLAVFDRYQGRFYGVLAEDWYWEDEYTFVVELHEEAEFRNGDDLTAQDVIWNYENTTEEYGIWQPPYKQKIESVTAEGKYTIKFHVHENFPSNKQVKQVLETIIVDPERWQPIFEEYGEDLVKFRNFDLGKINGSGPYTPAISNKQQCLLVRIDDYWSKDIGRQFAPKYVKWLFTGSTETLERLMKAGQTDVLRGITTEFSVAYYNDQTGAKRYLADRSGIGMVPNPAKSIFRQRWLKRALQYAMNTEKMDEATPGQRSIGASIPYINPALPDYEEYVNMDVVSKNYEYELERGVPVFKQNIQKAVQILEEHCEGSPEDGWTITDPVGNPDLEGKELGGWSIMHMSGAGWAGGMAEVAIQNWERIGIKDLSVAAHPWGTFYSRYQNNEFDFFLWDTRQLRNTYFPYARTYFNNFVSKYLNWWAGSPFWYQTYWTEDYPETEDTADEVASLVEDLWVYERGSTKHIETVKELQSIIVPQLPQLIINNKMLAFEYNNNTWTNHSTSDDPYALPRPGYDFPRFSHVYSTSIETLSFELSPGRVKAGEQATATVELKNNGEYAHEYELEIAKGPAKKGPGPDPIAEKFVEVPAGETVTVDVPVVIETPGSYTLTVDDWRIGEYDPGSPIEKTLIVEEAAAAMISPSTLTLSKAVVEPEETTTISVDISNTGDTKGSETVEITLDGETIKSETVTLEPGETTTITTEVSESTEGTYTVRAGELTRSFEVAKPEEVISKKLDLAISKTADALEATNEVKNIAQGAVDAANSAQSTAEEAKTAAEEAKTAAEEVEGGASTSMVIASMVITIIVVLGGVYVMTRRQTP